MICFREATKRFPDGTLAVRNVTLDVPKGQFCVILGSSGAGKSTLLGAANGLITLTGGSVLVNGIVVSPKTLREVRALVGTVHQSFGVVGRATVLDNVLNGALREVSTPRALFGLFPEHYRKKACTLLSDLGLAEAHLYRRAAELSGGQQQRVAIARAFMLDPAVVLADEPVASLDMAMSHTILRLLRETSAKRGTTVLCNLHQVDLARTFADRIVAMRDGEIIADGPPSEFDEGAQSRIYGAGSLGDAVPSVAPSSLPSTKRPPEEWKLKSSLSKRSVAFALAACVLLGISAQRTLIPKIGILTAEWVAQGLGLSQESQVGKGLGRFFASAFPLVIAERTPVARIDGFDRDHLPFLSHVEKAESTTSHYDFEAKKMVPTIESEEVLVKPIGYVVYVVGKMLQSLEIALWGTLLALALAMPLSFLGAKGYSPHRVVYAAARTTSSFLRAVPELVSALILVLAFGFGPMAGVLALGFHAGGFLGKFFADDVENADRGPQEALVAAGANKLKVLRHAVLPQVLPQYVAYTQYILERNVRMATVIGVVGAGGIGIELKGRFDMFDFGHVSTILVVIFITVLILEQISQRVRSRLIATG